MNPGLSACKADALPLSYTPFMNIGRRAGTSLLFSVVVAIRSIITKIEIVTPWNLSVNMEAGNPAKAV